MKAAAAFGVAGALAFAFNSTGEDTAAQASSGHDAISDTDLPTAADHEKTDKADEPERTGLAPTSSAEPKLLPSAQESTDRSQTAGEQDDSTQSPLTATTTAAQPKPSATPEQSDQDTGSSSDGSSAEPTSPSSTPEPQQPDDGSDQDRPLTGTVDDVLGGITGTVGGLLGG